MSTCVCHIEANFNPSRLNLIANHDMATAHKLRHNAVIVRLKRVASMHSIVRDDFQHLTNHEMLLHSLKICINNFTFHELPQSAV